MLAGLPHTCMDGYAVVLKLLIWLDAMLDIMNFFYINIYL